MVAFETVVIVVCVVSAVIATVAFVGARRLYDRIGRLGPLSMTSDDELDDRAQALVRQEVNETLSAISALREARGEQLPPGQRGDEAARNDQPDPDSDRPERRSPARGA